MADELGPGQLLVVDGVGPHRVGGEHALRGAWCPNCRKPLMLHVMLDCTDPALAAIGHQFPTLPLLYCSRCIIRMMEPLIYRQTTGDEVELLECYVAPSRTDIAEWCELGPGIDVLPEARASLKALPRRVQLIYDALNDGASEDEKMCEAVAEDLRPLIPSYDRRGIWPPNLVMGRAYNWQHWKPMPCHVCYDEGRCGDTHLLASLYSDPEQKLLFGFEGQQILFYLCRECGAIAVTNFVG